jgi:hypothetical protein
MQKYFGVIIHFDDYQHFLNYDFLGQPSYLYDDHINTKFTELVCCRHRGYSPELAEDKSQAKTIIRMKSMIN